jgi:hypothetical protein
MDSLAALGWLWSLLVGGSIASIYGLRRLALWMEKQGWIYYLHKKPTSSPMGRFVALQQVIEPRSQHVLHVSRVNHVIGEERITEGDQQDSPKTERTA